MPDLSDLPENTRVFVDTNIFDYALSAKSLSCMEFTERVARREIKAYVNTQVLSDLIHKLMLKEAFAKQLIPIPSANKLKECFKKDQAKSTLLTDYQQQFEKLLADGLQVLPITKQLLIETKIERATYALLTNDSIHIGTMSRCKVNRRDAPLYDIVTNDDDFAAITDITVWKPNDLPNL